MLLTEITPNLARRRNDRPNPKVLGHGVQGTAFRTNKPNTIRKVYGLDSLNDPYYQFIETIRKHQDNPFFPRIYAHRVFKNHKMQAPQRTQYTMTGVVMMEKLVALNNPKIDNDVVLSLFHNMGIALDSPFFIWKVFKNRAALQEMQKTTTNGKFAKALDILLSSGRQLFDLHAGNWMIRLTGSGPQLVILDPVFGSDDAPVNASPEWVV